MYETSESVPERFSIGDSGPKFCDTFQLDDPWAYDKYYIQGLFGQYFIFGHPLSV